MQESPIRTHKNENLAIKADFAKLKKEIRTAKFDIIKWLLPFILGIYALIAYKH